MSYLMKILAAVLLLLLHPIPWALASEAGTWKLDDFEDGDLKAATGLSWFLIADDLAGGASETRLEIRPGGAARSRHALRLVGRLNGSRGWPFAGMWASLDGSGRSVDLGKFEGIRLRVKGPAKLQVGLRSGMDNFMAEISAGPEWKLVDVPFSTLVPLGKVPEGTRWDPSAVEVFGITTPQVPRGEERGDGKVDFQVDDIVLYGKGENPAPVASGATGSVSTVPFAPLASIPKEGWIELATDPTGDGKMPLLPDATRLETIPSSPDGLLWVRITLREPPHDRWLGMNLVLDVDGDSANGKAWWGANKSFKFDEVLTVWCFHVADGCQGYLGVAGADPPASGTLTGGRSLRFAIDKDRRAYILGVPRDVLHLERDDFRLVAAVGSALLFNDDVPGQGAASLR